MMMKFNPGPIYATREVATWCEKNGEARNLSTILDRHVQGDWGEVPPEDAQANEQALIDGRRLLSAYTLDGEKIWIITEADRSSTMVLFPSDY